jgi:hypothetical protein
MTKTYRDWSTDQSYLFPPSPHEWLPEGDLVYFLLDTVATLDLSPIFSHYDRELRGQPPFHPRMMVALLLYCYATGTRSSRKIMRRCHVDVACRVIVGSDVPDFRTISDFRKIHLARLEALSSRSSSSVPWPGWPRSAPLPWMAPRSRPTPRGTRR